MNSKELETAGLERQVLEVLIDGVWYRAMCVAYLRTTGQYAHAEFLYWKSGNSEPLQLSMPETSFSRIRRLLANRVMTLSEIDACQQVGLRRSKEHVSIEVTEFEALCRTARGMASVSETNLVASVVAKIAEAIGGWYPNAKPTLVDCLSSIKSMHEHKNKLADALNGPTGARKEAEALEFRAKAVEEKVVTAKAEITRLHGTIAEYKKQALDRADVLAKVGDALRAAGEVRPGVTYVETIHDMAKRLKSAPWLEIEELHRRQKTILQERDKAVVGRQEFARKVAHALGAVGYADPNWPSEVDVVRNVEEFRARCKTAEIEREAHTAIAEANVVLRAKLLNWRSEIPGHVLEQLERVATQTRSSMYRDWHVALCDIQKVLTGRS